MKVMNDVHSWIKRSFKSTNVGSDMGVSIYEGDEEGQNRGGHMRTIAKCGSV